MLQRYVLNKASDAHGHGQASQEPEQASAVAGVDGQAAQGVLVGVALTFAGYVSEGLFTLAWIPRVRVLKLWFSGPDDGES